MRPLRVLVCGDRNWTDRRCIAEKLEALHCAADLVVIHGGCRGADQIAGEIAEGLDVSVETYWANWKRFGLGAGPIRNQQMLDEGKPDLVLAFHPDLSQSKGTADMVRRAKAAGVTCLVFESKEEKTDV